MTKLEGRSAYNTS